MQLTPKQCIRPTIFLLAALCVGVFFDWLLCIPLLLFAVFFMGVDVFNIGLATPNDFDMDVEFHRNQEGVLGEYILDMTKLYGMFIKLSDISTFMDIKKDKYFEKRKEYARFLFEHKVELEISLNKFLDRNPEFKSKKITGIGLFSKDLNQGEVFWDPGGYTIFRGLEFCDE